MVDLFGAIISNFAYVWSESTWSYFAWMESEPWDVIFQNEIVNQTGKFQLTHGSESGTAILT